MIKFKKRSYHADCIQWDGTNFDEIKAMLGDGANKYGEDYIMIRHEAGIDTMREGHWVVQGENGQVKTYTDEQFHVKYERA